MERLHGNVARAKWEAPRRTNLDTKPTSHLRHASNECGRAATAVELFIRSASVLPKRPAVLLTDASPDQVRKQSSRRHGRLFYLSVIASLPKLDHRFVLRQLSIGCVEPRGLFGVPLRRSMPPLHG